MNSYMITAESLSVFTGGNFYQVPRHHKNWDAIVLAITESRWDDIPGLIDVAQKLRDFGHGITVEDGVVHLDGKPISGPAVEHFLDIIDADLPAETWAAYTADLFKNSSYRVINYATAWIAKNKSLTLMPDGRIVGYKAIRSDWFDKHTGKSNCYTIGSVHTMPRGMVDDNPDNGCSYGLHVGSYDYAKSFSSYGDRIVLVAFWPSDIVSVPTEDEAKVRVCKLEVIAEYNGTGVINDRVYSAA